MLLEDEVFNCLWIDLSVLLIGKIKMLFSLIYLRLVYWLISLVEVENSMVIYDGSDFEGDELMIYIVIYLSYKWILEIVFEKVVFYVIVGWKDIYFLVFDC